MLAFCWLQTDVYKRQGYQFYNTSRFTFETLLADPDNIESHFRDYLSGFSEMCIRDRAYFCYAAFWESLLS